MKKLFSFFLFLTFFCSLNSMNDPRELIVRDDALPGCWALELQQLFNEPVDISYIETPIGINHLKRINDSLQRKSLRINFETNQNNVIFSINLCAPSEDGAEITLLPLFSRSHPIASSSIPAQRLSADHLNKLQRTALAMRNETKIIKPVLKAYLKSRPFSTKMISAWNNEIKAAIAEHLAQHIGRELAKAVLVGIGMAETTPPIISDWNKQLSDSVQSLNSQEAHAERLIFLKKYHDLRTTSAKQNELFMKTYEQLLTV